MTMKVAKGITLASVLIAILIPVLSGIITHQVTVSLDKKSQAIECLENRMTTSEKDIQVIKATMPTIDQIDELQKHNNDELIRMLFEKGYIRKAR